MQPSTYPASIYSVFLPHSLPQTQILVSSFIMSPSCSKTLCDSHCLQNQVQIPKPSSQELASATLPSISTLEFPLCARYLLFFPPNPHSACLYWLSSGEPGCGISFSSQGWWIPGGAWPIGREGRSQAGGPRDGAERTYSLL